MGRSRSPASAAELKLELTKGVPANAPVTKVRRFILVPHLSHGISRDYSFSVAGMNILWSAGVRRKSHRIFLGVPDVDETYFS
jgi:hypothetical protein